MKLWVPDSCIRIPKHIVGNGLIFGGGGGSPPAAFSITSAVAGVEQVTVTWPTVAGALTYTIKRGTSSGVYGTTLSTNATSPYVDTGLTGGTLYYYRVYAVNASGTTTSTNEVSATPTAAFANAKSMLFDGVDEFVTFGNNFAFERTTPFTISGWHKTPSSMTTISAFLAKRNAAQTVGYAILPRESLNAWVCQLLTSTGGVFDIRGSFTWATSTWYHLALTSTGAGTTGTVKFYVNKTLLAATETITSFGAGTMITTDPFCAMKDGASALYQGGNCDEVSIWNAALSLSEIGEIYDQTAGDISLLSFYASKCLSWYRMGDSTDSITTIVDRKGAVNGTPTNMESGDIVSDVP